MAAGGEVPFLDSGVGPNPRLSRDSIAGSFKKLRMGQGTQRVTITLSYAPREAFWLSIYNLLRYEETDQRILIFFPLDKPYVPDPTITIKTLHLA